MEGLDNLRHDLLKTASQFKQVAEDFKSVYTIMEKKISESIPKEEASESQKKITDGMMLAALGATSLFGNLIKEGMSLADFGLNDHSEKEVPFNTPEDPPSSEQDQEETTSQLVIEEWGIIIFPQERKWSKIGDEIKYSFSMMTQCPLGYSSSKCGDGVCQL